MKCIYLFLLASILACQPPKEQAQKQPISKPSLPIEYTVENVPVVDYDGLKPIFENQNDTTYIINFWATWCKPCVAELPYFETLHQKHLNKPVKVILVSLDFKKNYATKLIPFLNKNKIASDVVLFIDPDSNSWIDKINPGWSGAIPATVIYKNSNRGFYEQTFESYDELKSLVDKYLK